MVAAPPLTGSRGRTIAATTRRTFDDPDAPQAALERATLRLVREFQG